MIGPDGFFDWAVRDPGPADRWANFGFARTPMTAITHHSLEGTFTRVNGSGYNVMRDPSRFPTAWHGTVLRFSRMIDGVLYDNGTLFQHYPVFARLQHGNSANVLGPGFEAEEYGTAGNSLRLTPAQEDTYLHIHADMAAFTGRQYLRVPGSRTGLVEHREMTTPPGGTACPSNLYDGLWARIAEGEDMTPEEVQSIVDKALAQQEMAYRAAVGASPIRHAQAVNQRLWAINAATDPAKVPGDK
jgi:hypothetical protein